LWLLPLYIQYFHNLAMKLRSIFPLVTLIVFVITLSACQSPVQDTRSSGKIKVIATTTIVGDVTAQVGGDLIELNILLPVGADPHSFTPTPQDIARLADADLIFANGLGLEAFLDDLIESVGAQNRVIHVSDGVKLIESGTEDHGEAGEEHGNEHTGNDPHTWTDPQNVKVWVHNIKVELSRIDPANAQSYQRNAADYTAELTSLDTWIEEQVSSIPVDNKQIVTDHALFGYYAAAYGFQQVGTLLPGYSTLSEPSAQDLANIEDVIQQYQVNSIFVGKSANPSLAARVAEDTGTRLVSIYTGSLSEAGGEADSYLDYMRYNTTAFVSGLK
jgi:ABC-type Zn uptake system ZnuABC Zn-binding protein ZnuA